jgi:hypothetical protein
LGRFSDAGHAGAGPPGGRSGGGPDAAFEALPRDRRDTPSRKHALCAAQEIIRAIDAGMEGNSLDFLRSIIARAQVHADRIEVALHAGQVVTALLTNDVRIPVASEAASPEASTEADADGAVRLRLTVPAALKRTGKEMKFVIEGADENGTPDPSLVRPLVRAHALSRRLAATPGSTLADVGSPEIVGLSNIPHPRLRRRLQRFLLDLPGAQSETPVPPKLDLETRGLETGQKAP